MSELFHLDYETKAVPDLNEVGVDVYLEDPYFEVIMANYARGDRKIKTWEPHLNSKIPAELEDALLDPFTTTTAWGAASFEQLVTKKAFGIDKPVDEWFCIMSLARFAGIPGKLEDAGKVLQLGKDSKRDGGKLINLFCLPTDLGGQETLFGVSEPLFNTPYTHPEEWAQFVDYGKYDIVSERAALKKLQQFIEPFQQDRETWLLDCKINRTGWPTDQLLIGNAKEIALRTRIPLLARLKEISGVENPNSRDQFLEWIQTQGYLFDGLGKELVQRALNGDCDLTPAGRESLELRVQTAKSSISKYTALADMTSADGRLRHQYTYYGAHTGRWAAHGVNVGNLLRPTKEVEKNLNLAIDLVRKMDYDEIVRKFKSPLDVAAGVQRSAFRAPDGFKFVWADLNAIENRDLGYIARCEAINKVFREKFTYHGPDVYEYGTKKLITEGMQFPLDPYIAFATRMYNQSYHDLWVEWKIKGDSTKRTFCKPPVLGGGYALGPGEERTDSKGMSYFTGLMGYGRNMGIELSQEVCTKSIAVLREEWKEVTWLWKDMERAAAFSIRHPGHLTGVGVPELKYEFDLFERLGRKVQEPIINFKCNSDKVLEMILPSGRPLYYWSPRVEVQHKTWTGIKDGRQVTREYDQDVIFYHAKDPQTKQWVETDTFGGHLVENADQGDSRDILVPGMKLADKMGFELVGSTYDEVITLVPITSGLGVKELCDCLSTVPDRYNGQLQLAAEGTEDIVYHK